MYVISTYLKSYIRRLDVIVAVKNTFKIIHRGHWKIVTLGGNAKTSISILDILHRQYCTLYQLLII